MRFMDQFPGHDQFTIRVSQPRVFSTRESAGRTRQRRGRGSCDAGAQGRVAQPWASPCAAVFLPGLYVVPRSGCHLGPGACEPGAPQQPPRSHSGAGADPGTLALLSQTAYRLRVEYLAEPLGIEALSPRFSWSLAAVPAGSRDVEQAGYRLVVTNHGTGAVALDTGMVASSATSAAPLQLSPADSDITLDWTVEVWDDAGGASTTTRSTFGTGLLSPVGWGKARWIGGSLLRRSFTLPAPARGKVRISCPGYCIVTVNGKRATDAVLGHQTVYERTVLYDTYDVSRLLKHGENAIGVEVGNGWYGSFETSCQAVASNKQDCAVAMHGHSNPLKCLPTCWQAQPGALGNQSVLLQLSVMDSAGNQTRLVSDLTWKQSAGVVVSDDIYKGETQDLRLEQEGWDTPGFDASGWASADAVVPPDGKLLAAAYPPIRVANTTLSSQSIERLGVGRYLVDFGKNTAAIIRLEVPMSTDELTIKLTTHEQLNASGEPAGPYPSTQLFILPKRTTPTIVQTKFTYFGFQ